MWLWSFFVFCLFVFFFFFLIFGWYQKILIYFEIMRKDVHIISKSISMLWHDKEEIFYFFIFLHVVAFSSDLICKDDRCKYTSVDEIKTDSIYSITLFTFFIHTNHHQSAWFYTHYTTFLTDCEEGIGCTQIDQNRQAKVFISDLPLWILKMWY